MTDQPQNPTYPAPGPTPAGPDQLSRFFDWIRRSGFVRGTDRWFAGVCSAVARRTGLDPAIVRGIAVVLAVLGAPVLFVYAIGWALLPNALGRIHAEEAVHRRFEPAMIAIAALLLFTAVPFSRGFWWDGPPAAWGVPGWLSTSLGAAWGLGVVVGIVWLVLYLVRRSPKSGPGPAAGPNPGFSPGAYPGAQPGAQPGAHPGAQPGSQPGSQAGAQAGVQPGAPATDAATGIPTPPPAGWAPPPPAAPYSAAAYSAAPYSTAPYSAAGAAYPTDYQADYRAHKQAAGQAQGDQQYRAWQEQSRQRADRDRAWRDQNQAWQEQQRARQAEHAAWRRRRRPSAAVSATTLGLALVAGAIAALTLAGGRWSNAALVLGLAVALGVVAIGIIVSGIRGRESGALGGLAFLAVVALVLVGWIPQGTQFDFAGTHRWTVGSSAANAAPGYAMFAGTPTVDLTALDQAGAGDGRVVDVWLGFGVTTLVLPSDRPVQVEVNLLAGVVDTGTPRTEQSRTGPEQGGVFIKDVRAFNGTDARSIPRIRVWSLAGRVTITGAATAVGTAR